MTNSSVPHNGRVQNGGYRPSIAFQNSFQCAHAASIQTPLRWYAPKTELQELQKDRSFLRQLKFIIATHEAPYTAIQTIEHRSDVAESLREASSLLHPVSRQATVRVCAYDVFCDLTSFSSKPKSKYSSISSPLWV